MQTLSIDAVFPADPATMWEIFESEAFRARVEADTGMTAKLLEERMEGDVSVRKFAYTSGRDLPTIAAKALGASRLSYEQTNRLDLAKGRLDWSIHLPVVSDRVKIGGYTTILPDGDGCRRRVEGTLEVKMRFVGGQIEKAVVGEFAKSMTRVNDIAREMLAAR